MFHVVAAVYQAMSPTVPSVRLVLCTRQPSSSRVTEIVAVPTSVQFSSTRNVKSVGWACSVAVTEYRRTAFDSPGELPEAYSLPHFAARSSLERAYDVREHRKVE
jgi:hypothetical protein